MLWSLKKSWHAALFAPSGGWPHKQLVLAVLESIKQARKHQAHLMKALLQSMSSTISAAQGSSRWKALVLGLWKLPQVSNWKHTHGLALAGRNVRALPLAGLHTVPRVSLFDVGIWHVSVIHSLSLQCNGVMSNNDIISTAHSWQIYLPAYML
jgi:hypothetical protein